MPNSQEEKDEALEESLEIHLVSIHDTNELEVNPKTLTVRMKTKDEQLNSYFVKFLIGMLSGVWLLWKFTRRSSIVRARTVGTQSQVTYTELANYANPRFQPLPESRQGAFSAGGLPLV